MREHDWAVVLATGDDVRSSALMMGSRGRPVPRQFCSLDGRRSLFELALERARGAVPAANVCAVVAEPHALSWAPLRASLAPGNVLVQPHDRGSANAVLFALLHIQRRDPRARVIFLPADHHVLDEAVLIESMRGAMRLLQPMAPEIYLLGIEPDDPDPEAGYVIPRRNASHYAAPGVLQFVDKPAPPMADAPMAAGALWNSFIFAAEAGRLIDVFQTQHPAHTMRMQAAFANATREPHPSAPAGELGRVYRDLAPLDVSRHVLTRHAEPLRVVRVPHCGWSQLGNASRLWERVQLLAGKAGAAPLPGNVPVGAATAPIASVTPIAATAPAPSTTAPSVSSTRRGRPEPVAAEA